MHLPDEEIQKKDPSYLYYISHDSADYLHQEKWVYKLGHDVCETKYGYFVATACPLDGFVCLNQSSPHPGKYLTECSKDFLIRFYGAAHRAHRRPSASIESLYLEALENNDLMDSFVDYVRTKNDSQRDLMYTIHDTVLVAEDERAMMRFGLRLRSNLKNLKRILNEHMAEGPKEEFIPRMIGLLDISLSALKSVQENRAWACWISLSEVDRFALEVLKELGCEHA